MLKIDLTTVGSIWKTAQGLLEIPLIGSTGGVATPLVHPPCDEVEKQSVCQNFP
jgi:hypothetical protein